MAERRHLPAAFWDTLAPWNTGTMADLRARRWNELIGPFYREDQAAALLGGLSREELANVFLHRELLALITVDGMEVFPAFQFDGRRKVSSIGSAPVVLWSPLSLWPGTLCAHPTRNDTLPCARSSARARYSRPQPNLVWRPPWERRRPAGTFGFSGGGREPESLPTSQK